MIGNMVHALVMPHYIDLDINKVLQGGSSKEWLFMKYMEWMGLPEQED